jgi:hypothetical protein
LQLTYLDQNALIELGRRARGVEPRQKPDSIIESGCVNFVVSLWHLIETANTTNLTNAIELARFIDSLRPKWLLERRDIQKLDVEEDFYRFFKLDYETKPRVTTRSAGGPADWARASQARREHGVSQPILTQGETA